tara:strand:- start:70 stop:225 length:156 start_codon:yes stop_codon:yes gene_type:complete
MIFSFQQSLIFSDVKTIRTFFDITIKEESIILKLDFTINSTEIKQQIARTI